MGAVIVIAMLCASAPMVTEALARRAGSPPQPEHLPGLNVTGRAAAFTTVLRLGSEPAEIARTSIILAARIGPTTVVTTARHPVLDDLGPVDVAVFVAPTIESALFRAAPTIATEACIVLSASAFPLAEPCRRAAALLRDDVGWVTGRAVSPNNDRYAPCEREKLAEQLRSDARGAGATLWEPDATMVRTDLLARYPVDEGRPLGSWLRDLERHGYRGQDVGDTIAHRAAPADAPAFWPSAMMRTRAAAADLAGARASGPVRGRALAAAALTRELYAWPLAMAALVPLLVGWSGSFPLSVPPALFVAAIAVAALGRWSATRLVHGIGLHPIHDARAAAYSAPGSFAALPSVVSHRIRPQRVSIPEQPLLWAALALTLATTILLVERATTADTGADIAAGVAVVDLVFVWLFAIRAVGQRGWDRAVYRLTVDLPATVEGHAARIVEASPLGLAVVAPLAGPLASLPVGSPANVVVGLAGGRALTMRAVVADRRTGGASQLVLGLALQLRPQDRVDWVGALFDAAPDAPNRSRPGTAHLATRARPPRSRTLAFRFQMLVVGGVSLIAVSVLGLVFLGFRPLVISGGSMQPTLRIGDVVVTAGVRADQLRVGDIVSFHDDADGGRLITHRVRSVVTEGNRVRIETRGDANSVSEIWDAPDNALFRRTVFEVPSIGGVASAFGSPLVRDGLFAGGTALAALAAGTVLCRAERRNGRAGRGAPDAAQGASMRSIAPPGNAPELNERAVPNAKTDPSRPSR